MNSIQLSWSHINDTEDGGPRETDEAREARQADCSSRLILKQSIGYCRALPSAGQSRNACLRIFICFVIIYRFYNRNFGIGLRVQSEGVRQFTPLNQVSGELILTFTDCVHLSNSSRYSAAPCDMLYIHVRIGTMLLIKKHFFFMGRARLIQMRGRERGTCTSQSWLMSE